MYGQSSTAVLPECKGAMRAIAEDSVSPAMALCGIVADDGREAANGGRWSMTDTAISLLVAVLLLPGIGVAAARARRRGDPRRSLRLRLILPALFFAAPRHRIARRGRRRRLGPRRVACVASRDGRWGRSTRLTRLYATRMGVSGDQGHTPARSCKRSAAHALLSTRRRGHTPATAGCDG